MKAKQKSPNRAAATVKKSAGFTAEERAAMKERARELKADAARADGEKELRTAIAKMEQPARSMATKLHALLKVTDPSLAPKTWYGMPAYAKDGNVVCFFKNAGKFKTRYSTLGFSDKANLDDGTMWPTEFALTTLTPADEAKIAALVKRAVS
ncbi:MAG: hypothetical protein WB867_05530 [Candidatus Dormiibacterota bacterium]